MKYAVCSDIHLGHSKTPTEHIIRSFKDCILTESNKDCEILFISGDLFDRLLDLNTREVHRIVEFFHSLLNYCFQHHIRLRVLEGTPSHDWQQSQLLVKLNDIREEPVDLKYFKVLDIEHIQALNTHILYIPDEWVNTQQELELQIAEKLNEHAISQVDIAILHGQFAYQVKGKHFSGLFYDEAYFLNLVKGFIHIGHYHTYSYLDRIIANGSLERLAHGEEDDKGYVVVTDQSYAFIPNPNAYIYKTISVTKATTIDTLDKIIRKYPPRSHLRLLVDKDHPFSINFQELKVRYPDHHLKKKTKETATADNTVTYILREDELDLSGKFIIDTDIIKAVLTSIEAKHDLTLEESAKLCKYLEVFNDVSEQNDGKELT